MTLGEQCQVDFELINPERISPEATLVQKSLRLRFMGIRMDMLHSGALRFSLSLFPTV